MARAGLWEGYRTSDGKAVRTYCVIITEVNAAGGDPADEAAARMVSDGLTSLQ